MNQLSPYFVIAESMEGNIIRLQAISGLLDGVEGPGYPTPKGTTLLIDDVVDSLNETLSYLYKAAHEGNTSEPDSNIGEDFSPPDLPGQ